MIPTWGHGHAASRQGLSRRLRGLILSANCSLLFTEHELLERPAAASAAGFTAVEYWWPFEDAVPADATVDRFVSSIQDSGVQLAALNFFAGDMPAGDRGIVSSPQRSSEFRANVEVIVEIGQQLGTRRFNALYGNRLPDASPAEQDEVAVENLAAAAAAVAPFGGTVLIEPLSGAANYPLLTFDHARGVMQKALAVNASNVRVLADLFHLAANGEDLDATCSQAHVIGHVQIADLPGRGEPGTGAMDLYGYLASLVESGYRGHIGLEYKPTTTTLEGLSWLDSHPWAGG